MDLGRCPKCGRDWVPGAEMCRACGFVPIGAGIRAGLREAEQQLKVRQVNIDAAFGLERQPGSRNGLIATACFLAFLGFSFDQKIWVNDWEAIRALMGAPRSLNIVGTWGVVETKMIDQVGVGHRIDGLYGTMQFGKNGTVRLALTRGVQDMDATGTYMQSGDGITLKQLTGTNGSSPLPPVVHMKLVVLDRKANTMQIDVEGRERLTMQFLSDQSR